MKIKKFFRINRVRVKKNKTSNQRDSGPSQFTSPTLIQENWHLLHSFLCPFLLLFNCFFLIMVNILRKSVGTHFTSKFFFVVARAPTHMAWKRKKVKRTNVKSLGRSKKMKKVERANPRRKQWRHGKRKNQKKIFSPICFNLWIFSPQILFINLSTRIYKYEYKLSKFLTPRNETLLFRFFCIFFL